jgi:small GTP-binding protein
MSVPKATIANTFKIVVVGSSGVGKSAIVQRLVDETFREETRSTVGVEFKPIIIPVGDQTVKLQIWDTAGQERFRSVSRAYFRNAVGGVLVFDIASDSSFDDLDEWLHDLQQLANPNAYIMLVGNKSDLEAERRVGAQQARDFAEKHKLDYIETSALTGANVTEAFTRLAFAVAKMVASGQIQNQGTVAKGPPFRSEERKQPDLAEQPPAQQSCC